MLSGSIYAQLADLNELVFDVLSKVRDRAPASEVSRLVKEAREAQSALADLLEPVSLKGDLDRHLHFLAYYYAREQHSGYEGDLVDIPTRDLPAIAQSVRGWQQRHFDAELIDAIDVAWGAGNFRAVVRDAFVHLEARLRRVGAVPPGSGLSGDRLVNRVLSASSPHRVSLAGDHALAPVTTGEEEGAYYLLKGALLLWRNPSAHRALDYSPEEAEALVRLVDLCIRLLDPLARR